jgi:hypothetical protein
MIPEFGLGTTLAYNALNEEAEWAEKVKAARKARQAQNWQHRREQSGNLLIKLGRWVAKQEPNQPEFNLK